MRITYVGGAGRLGFPSAYWSACEGHEVIVADVNKMAVKAINKTGVVGTEPLPSKTFRGSLLATVDTIDAVRRSEMSFVIVPTPSMPDGRFDLSYVLAACDDVGKGTALNKNDHHIVVIVSTVNPGDTRDFIIPQLENASGLKHDVDFDVVYSPEFVAQGTIVEDFANPAILLLGGTDPDSLGRVCKYYGSVTENEPEVHLMSIESAEIAKIGLNTALSAKMAVANQIAWLCHYTPNADAKQVLASIGDDPRIGRRYFMPGPPDGGPCLPRDGRALVAAGKPYGLTAGIAEAVDKFRGHQMGWICFEAGRIIRLYESKKTLVLGLAYKPGVDLLDESPGVMLLDAFLENGYDVRAWDPATCKAPLEKVVAESDLLIIMTPWPEIEQLQNLDLTNKVIFDMWGMFTGLDCREYIRFGAGERR